MWILILDTETTGLPKTKKMDPDQWPHIVQLSYILLDVENNQPNLEKVYDRIVRIAGTIPKEASNIHGITTEQSHQKGIRIEDALETLMSDCNRVSEIVGHNIEFDVGMVVTEAMRYLKAMTEGIITRKKSETAERLRVFLETFQHIPRYCTMKQSTDLCAIKKRTASGKEYNKYPRLGELHHHLFGTTPTNLHNSLVDVYVCLYCFWKLRYSMSCSLSMLSSLIPLPDPMPLSKAAASLQSAASL